MRTICVSVIVAVAAWRHGVAFGEREYHENDRRDYRDERNEDRREEPRREEPRREEPRYETRDYNRGYERYESHENYQHENRQERHEEERRAPEKRAWHSDSKLVADALENGMSHHCTSKNCAPQINKCFKRQGHGGEDCAERLACVHKGDMAHNWKEDIAGCYGPVEWNDLGPTELTLLECAHHYGCLDANPESYTQKQSLIQMHEQMDARSLATESAKVQSRAILSAEKAMAHAAEQQHEMGRALMAVAEAKMRSVHEEYVKEASEAAKTQLMLLMLAKSEKDPKVALQQMNEAKANLMELQKGMYDQMHKLAELGGDTKHEEHEEEDFSSIDLSKFLNSMKEEDVVEKKDEMAIDTFAHKDWAKLAEEAKSNKPGAALVEVTKSQPGMESREDEWKSEFPDAGPGAQHNFETSYQKAFEQEKAQLKAEHEKEAANLRQEEEKADEAVQTKDETTAESTAAPAAATPTEAPKA